MAIYQVTSSLPAKKSVKTVALPPRRGKARNKAYWTLASFVPDRK